MGEEQSGRNVVEEVDVPDWLKRRGGKGGSQAKSGSDTEPERQLDGEAVVAPVTAGQERVNESPGSVDVQEGKPYSIGGPPREEQEYYYRDAVPAGEANATGTEMLDKLTGTDRPDETATRRGRAMPRDGASVPGERGGRRPASDERVEIRLAPSPGATAPESPPAVGYPEPPVISKEPRYAPFFVGSLPESRAAAFGQPVPDTALDGADLAGLTVRGASLRGDRHRYLKEVRQDAMGIWQISDGQTAALLVCAADGVSSDAPFSHIGAAEACRLLRDLAAPKVSKFFRARGAQWVTDLWEDLAEHIGARMAAYAARIQVRPKDLSTTLAAALIECNPADPEDRHYVILNVGDARAFLLSMGEFLPCLPEAHASSDAITSTATSALPTSVGQVSTAFGKIGLDDMLMVCSDGMSDPMMNPGVRETLAGWWSGSRIPSVPEYGWQVSYRIATYDDDRTAVCVWGRGK